MRVPPFRTNRPPLPMTDHEPTPRPAPRPQPRVVLCPYCGSRSRDPHRCESCSGYFDPLSRQATQNAMGPWFIRDDAQPFRPGCSFETLRTLIHRGRITPETPLRGPTTRQFWVLAKRCPTVANLFGLCHACARPVEPSDRACRHCGVSFEPPPDRQQLGLGSVRLLPGHATPEDVAAMSDAPPSATITPTPFAVPEEPSVPAALDASAPAAPPDEAVHARVEILERNLRVLRRSRAVYLGAAIVVLLSAAFVFAAPSLGIGLGPVDAWLGRSPPVKRELAQPGLGTSDPVQVRPIPVAPPNDGQSRPDPNAATPGVSTLEPHASREAPSTRTEPAPAEPSRSASPALQRLEAIARIGTIDDLAAAEGLAARAVEEGADAGDAARLLAAAERRRAWAHFRTLP